MSAPQPVTRFDAFAEQYLAYSRREHTPSTARTRRSLIRTKLIPFFEDAPLRSINSASVERLLARNAHLSAGSRNRILSALRVLLRHAVELGVISQNPAATARRAREHVVPLPLVSLRQQERLLAVLPGERRSLFLAALDTGARLGELLRLSWSDVDLERQAMVFRQTKSGRPRVVRLSRRLTKMLGRLQAERDERASGVDGVFADAVGADGGLRWVLRRAFKEAARQIGYPRLRVHDLRHLAAINLVRAGVDLPTVQAHLGHKHLISTLRYAAYADETASARAARALDAIHDRNEPPGERT